jgi:hypothetical protein
MVEIRTGAGRTVINRVNGHIIYHQKARGAETPPTEPTDMATETNDTTAEKDTGTVRNYRTLTVTPRRLQAYTGRDRVDDLDERTLSLHDSEGGVTLATEGVDRDADETAGSLVELDAEQARQLADALFQAAAETEGDA